MRVGFFAPFPPARTGVADYAAALAARLRPFCDVRRGSAGDVCLYHIGNNQIHREIYARALERPGVTVLHDAVLQHFFLGCLGEDAYVEEFVYNYGEWHRGLAREMYRRRGASLAARYFEYPMLKRVAERSRAVVVHNPAAARIVRAHAPAARVIEIPHLWEPAPVAAAEALRFRERLGVAPGEYLFGIFGYLRESKRVLPALRVFHRVRSAQPRARLLLAGEFVSASLERAAALLAAAPGVIRLRYLQASDLRCAAAATDFCINLRYPSAGETSGIAVRLMGAGKPVAVTAGEENARYPEGACLPVDPGPGESEQLCEYMAMAARLPGLAAAIGRRAGGHVAEHHHAARVAERYWRALRDCAG